MAAPIKIAILADAGKAIKEVTHFRETVDEETRRVVTTLGDSKLTGGFGKVQEGFDVLDTRAMGFRDTITGVQDSMAAFNAMTTSTADATKRVKDAQIAYNDAVKKYGENSAQAVTANTELANATKALDQQQGSLLDKMFLMRMGVGDLASGFANFIVPVIAMVPALTAARTAMVGLNLAFLTNPVFLVVAAIVALVAVFVVAYKKSETFRKIVDGAFKGVLNAARGAWNWIKGNWPLLLAIITGPIGIAVRWVVKHWDTIIAKVKTVPKRIREAFSGAKDWLLSAGKNVVLGLWNGIKGMGAWLRGQIMDWARRSIPDPIAKILHLNSPSKVAIQIGRYFGEGIGIGLDQTQASVQRAAGRLAAATIATPPGGGPAGVQGRAGGATVRLVVDAADNDTSRFLARMLKEYVRVQGRGNVQVALGTR